MIFTIIVYDDSVKRQQIAAKKVYSIDTRLSNARGFTSSPNAGKLLENLAFLALRRKMSLIYNFTLVGFKVDFYLSDTHQLIQVAQTMDHSTAREHEIRGNVEAMGALGISSGLILTDTGSDELMKNGYAIQIRSVSECLIDS